jgi:acyl-coenzyme A thioesterase PaaI-like protein
MRLRVMLTYVIVKAAGVTSSMNVRYYQANVPFSEETVTISSKLLRMRRNLADIQVEIYNNENELCSEGLVTYFTFSEKSIKGNL